MPTDSGTAALSLAMIGAMQSTGRQHIALPGYCCYDLVTALNGAGASVVYYDVDPETLGPDWDSLEAALATRPAAVVVAHLFGLAVDVPRVLLAAEAAGALVIEDTAQGIGATLHRRPLGSFGHLRVLSFGRGKGVTGGKGGALLMGPGWRGMTETGLAPGRAGARELLVLSAQWLLARPTLFRIPASLPRLRLGDTVYRAPSPPQGMSIAAAAVVDQTWRLHPSEVEVRRRNATRLTRSIPPDGVELVRPIPGSDPAWLRLPVILPGVARNDPGTGLGRSLGVMPGYPQQLDRLDAAPPPITPLPLPRAARLAAELWTLPTHGQMRESDLKRLEQWLLNRKRRLRA